MSCNNVIPYIDNNCRKSIGGIKRIFAINSNEIEFINYDTETVNFIIPKNGSVFSEIKCVKDSASLTTTFVCDTSTGSGEYTSEFVFKIVEGEYNLWTESLSNTPIVFVVQNNRNEYYLVGDETNGAYLTNSVHTSGANLGEFNGEELTFTYTSDKPLWKCVVGNEITDSVGTYPYISEKLLENGLITTWENVEVDSGDLSSDLQDVVIDEVKVDSFSFTIGYSQETQNLFRNGAKIQLSDSSLDYYWFMKGDNNINSSIIDYVRHLSDEAEEPITVTKRIRQYLLSNAISIVNGYLPSVKINYVFVEYGDGQILLNWDTDAYIKSNAQVLVVDFDVNFYAYQGDITYSVYMNKAQQITGLG